MWVPRPLSIHPARFSCLLPACCCAHSHKLAQCYICPKWHSPASLSAPFSGGWGEKNVFFLFPPKLAGTLSPTVLQAGLMPDSPSSYLASGLGCCSLDSSRYPKLVLGILAAGVLCCVCLAAYPHSACIATASLLFLWSFHCSSFLNTSLRLPSLHFVLKLSFI